MSRSAPAVSNRSAKSRAEIGSRPRPFLSWRAYGKNGSTMVIRLAEARLSASTMIRLSITQVLIGVVQLWSTNASQPRTDSL